MRYTFVLMIFTILLLTTVVNATPVIENLTVNPSNPWLDDDITLTLSCYDTAGKEIERVYTNIVGPNVILPEFDFIGSYELTIDSAYFDRVGTFTATVTCLNNESEQVGDITEFVVSQLTGHINNIIPNPIRTDDVIEIHFVLEKDDDPITSGVSFEVVVSGESQELLLFPLYDTEEGWILRIPAIEDEGYYSLEITAHYQDTSIYVQQQIQVTDSVVFKISNIDNSWVEPNENIGIFINAFQGDNLINVNENNFDLFLDSDEMGIESITLGSDNKYNVMFVTPELAPGEYNLEVLLFYNNTYYRDTIKIYYVVPIEGTFIDLYDEGLEAEILFKQDDETKLSMSTNDEGEYSGKLPPDEYDIEITFPESKLILVEAEVDEYDDDIIYYYINKQPQGIAGTGKIHVFEVNITFEEAYIEIEYPNNILDESEIKLFKCKSWNPATMTCRSEWKITTNEIDTFRNKATTSQETLSAFTIGIRKGVKADLNFEHQNYYLGETGKAFGIVRDESDVYVPNATVIITINNEDFEAESDNNGLFTIDFISPDSEGFFNVYLKVEKEDFIEYRNTYNITVTKSKDITIVVPETIKIKRGENLLQKITVKNTGQTDMFDIKVELQGISNEYYELITNIEELKVGEEEEALIYFSIPEDSVPTTTAASIKIYNDYIEREETFGFTIEERQVINEEVKDTVITEPAFDITGLFSFDTSQLNVELLLIVVFAIILFYFTFKLKRKNKPKTKSSIETKNTLIDIKNHLKHINSTSNEKKERNGYFIDVKYFNDFLKKEGDEDGKSN
ncbi:carboxypeptidase-like regulatory domain-containing protein [Candidatus Aenigmatarchaeota archaeon]